ncbi:MAG: maleylpyruvate isomerase family mycothiol-dependent enzyme [Propionibacteriaceae bacterium]
MTDEALITSVREQTQLLASWAADADPTLPVPSCPDWKLADLVEHVGATQQWVARLTEDRITDPQAAFALSWVKAPAQPDAWSDWLHQSADRAAAAFAGAPSGADVFDPSGGNDGITFWRRRLFGEVSVHRIDAALTVGRPYELSAPLAGVAIDDWLDTISSPGWAANVPGFADAMRGDGQTIAWVADDLDRAWVLRRSDAPVTLIRGSAATAADTDVTVRGLAVDLLHLVSRRRPLGDDTTCQVSGDRDELVHLINNMKWVGG